MSVVHSLISQKGLNVCIESKGAHRGFRVKLDPNGPEMSEECPVIGVIGCKNVSNLTWPNQKAAVIFRVGLV